MTIKQLLGHFSINNNQVVHITDETRKCTYESDIGTFCFDDCFETYADMFNDDYEECLRYIHKMKVQYFSANNEMIWIHAE